MISNPEHFAATVCAVVAAVSVAIAVLGWAIGRLLPRVRFVAPFALAAIPSFLVISQDRAFQFVVMGPCLAAASTVAVYWWYRGAKGGRGPTAGGAGSGR